MTTWTGPGRSSWLVIAWLAVVNTALAYTLLNVALQTLRAVEISVILNTMLIQVALLAWIFLGESLTFRELFGLVVVTLGTALVQLRPKIVEAIESSSDPSTL